MQEEYKHRVVMSKSEIKAVSKLLGKFTGNDKSRFGLTKKEDDVTFEFYKRISNLAEK